MEQLEAQKRCRHTTLSSGKCKQTKVLAELVRRHWLEIQINFPAQNIRLRNTKHMLGYESARMMNESFEMKGIVRNLRGMSWVWFFFFVLNISNAIFLPNDKSLNKLELYRLSHIKYWLIKLFITQQQKFVYWFFIAFFSRRTISQLIASTFVTNFHTRATTR